MERKDIFKPLSKGAAYKNALIKRYPDGSYQITVFSRPTYKAGGMERSDAEEAAQRRHDLRAAHADLMNNTKNVDPRERTDNLRRAKQAIYDLAALNEWRYFITLTLDGDIKGNGTGEVRVLEGSTVAVKGTKTQFQLCDLRLQQDIVGLRVLSNTHDGIAAVQVADLYLVAVFQLLRFCLWNRLSDE